ncbi:MAG TPA: mevalonate kinase [Anaerolineales bacterium]|nr:mevalonate kinase [Anaerolineales bacterium]
MRQSDPLARYFMQTHSNEAAWQPVQGEGAAVGKIILFGEHAVVYGKPALAVPVGAVTARATIRPAQGEWIHAQNFSRRYALAQAIERDPLAQALRVTSAYCGQPLRNLELTVSSTIPVAGGLGSGAAVATATVRALADYHGVALTPETVAALTFESEKLLHGTPSGIDNTVIAYERPIVFVKGEPPVPLRVAQPFTLVIADTGVPSPTRVTVGDVAAARAREPERFDALFAEVEALVLAARAIIAGSDPASLGPLMEANQRLLEALGVSAEINERLCVVARQTGALGAKLSGGGRGGNVIALVTPEAAARVAEALAAAGAKRTIITEIGAQAAGPFG